MAILWTKVVSLVGNVGTNYVQIADNIGDIGLVEYVIVKTVTDHVGGNLQVAIAGANPETDGAETWLRLVPDGATRGPGGGGFFFGHGVHAGDGRGAGLLNSGHFKSSAFTATTDLYLKTKVTSANVTAGTLRVTVYGEPYGFLP